MSLWDINAHFAEDDVELEFRDVDIKNNLLFEDAYDATRNITFSDMPAASVVDEALYARTYGEDYLYEAVNGFARKVKLDVNRSDTEDVGVHNRKATVSQLKKLNLGEDR